MAVDDAAVARWLMTRGGYVQREHVRGEAEARGMDLGSDDPDERPPCALVEAILYLFGSGILSAPNCQWIANCALHAPRDHPDLIALASVGSDGKFAGNMRRYIIRHFAFAKTVPRRDHPEVDC